MKINLLPLFSFYLSKKLSWLFLLLLLSQCAEQKQKETPKTEVLQNTKKREKLTLPEAEASGVEKEIYTLEEKSTTQAKSMDTASKSNGLVSITKNKEDIASPVFEYIKISSDHSIALNDSVRSTGIQFYSADTSLLIEPQEKTLKNAEVRVHLTDIDADKHKYRSMETKKMFVQLETKVFFEGGLDILAEKYQSRLESLIEDVKDEAESYRTIHPNDSLYILVQIKGYADPQPFYKQQPEGQRKEWNQQLSDKRAAQVMSFLKRKLNITAAETELIKLPLGEDLPLGVHPSDQNDDINRRSCSIYILISNE